MMRMLKYADANIDNDDERRGDLELDPNAKLVILSGGQDSTTCLFQCVNDPSVRRLWAVSFDYDQRHRAELQSAAFVYELARMRAKPPYVMDNGEVRQLVGGIEMPRFRRVIRLPKFGGHSPLTDPQAMPERYRDYMEMDAKLRDLVELTFVPGRNLGFLYEAGKLALEYGYGTLVTGVNDADAGNYPDCRREFIEAMQKTWRLATRSNLMIETPLMGLDKEGVVHLSKQLPGCWEAMAFTTTDYDGAFPPQNNHASVLRAHGFERAGHPDPLIERAIEEGWLV
jgi:7-cyano-7-deazaguanine synthase